jgi:predicted class III extradiol MEMO1 family dioxygenase
MSEQTQSEDRAAIQTIAAVLGDSMRKVATAEEAQQISILGTAAIVACLPETAQIPRERLAAVIGLLSHGRSKEFRTRLAQFIGMAVTVSQRLPEIVAAQEAAKATKN